MKRTIVLKKEPGDGSVLKSAAVPSKARDRKGRQGHFPVAILAMALLLEISVFSYFVWHVAGSFRFVQTTTKQSLRIEELRGIIMRLDEVLTMSARMAAVTGDPQWEVRYNQFVPELDAAIKEATKLVPNHASADAAAQTDAADLKLIEMETCAFELVRQKRLQKARELLFSTGYEQQKKVYAAGMDRYIEHLRHQLTLTQSRERQRAIWSLIIAGAGLVMLIVAWGSVVLSLRRWSQTVFRNIAERESAEQSLREVLSGAQCLLWQATVGETASGLQCQVQIPGEEAAWEWLPLEAEPGQSYVDAWSQARQAASSERMEEMILQAVQSGKTKFRHKFCCGQADGRLRWLSEDVKIEAIAPARWQLIGVCTDITDLKSVEERLEHQAFHDALTGLPNRASFMNHLHQALARAKAANLTLAVLFVDFDNFKVINDSLGHEAGDRFLLERATALRTCIRSNDILARLGGDEFVIVFEGLAEDDTTPVIQVAERILEEFRHPVKLREHEVYSGASIGIALSAPGCEATHLLRDADTAMYQVKTEGKSAYALFDLSMNDRVNEQMEMESGLRAALEKGEFRVHYQPLIDLSTGQMTGTEALVRWEHPTKGLIAPGKFIPIAEETGLIIPIGYWVMEEACRQTLLWQSHYPDNPPLTVSVNISGRQLQRADVVERTQEILERIQFPPGCLKLEITESVMMKNVEEMIARLRQLKELGIKLAVDDFGTGYSSMAQLNSFPIDTIKIDRAFINRLGKHEDANATVAALIALARSLNMDITGEGVETEEQVAQLQALGCTLGQGFLFARPLTGEAAGEQIGKGIDSVLQGQRIYTREMIEQLLREHEAEASLETRQRIPTQNTRVTGRRAKAA